jgi:hypothetical protein
MCVHHPDFRLYLMPGRELGGVMRCSCDALITLGSDSLPPYRGSFSIIQSAATLTSFPLCDTSHSVVYAFRRYSVQELLRKSYRARAALSIEIRTPCRAYASKLEPGLLAPKTLVK